MTSRHLGSGDNSFCEEDPWPFFGRHLQGFLGGFADERVFVVLRHFFEGGLDFWHLRQPPAQQHEGL